MVFVPNCLGSKLNKNVMATFKVVSFLTPILPKFVMSIWIWNLPGTLPWFDTGQNRFDTNLTLQNQNDKYRIYTYFENLEQLTPTFSGIFVLELLVISHRRPMWKMWLLLVLRPWSLMIISRDGKNSWRTIGVRETRWTKVGPKKNSYNWGDKENSYK